MKFCEKPPMQGDCLWVTGFVVRKMFQFKIIRLILLAAIAAQLFIYLFEFYVFFIHPEYFLKYAPLLFARAYGFGTAIAILVKRNDVEEVFKRFYLWALDSVGVKHLDESRGIIFVSNSFTILILALVGFMTALYLPPGSSDSEYYLILLVVKQHYPEWISNSINVSMKLLIGPIYFSMLVHCFLVAYGAQHVLIQLRLCMVNLREIIDDYAGAYEELMGDDAFQEEIHRRLVFTFQRLTFFINLKRFVNDRLVRPLFLLFACSGFLLMISVLLMMYESHVGVYQDNIQSKILRWTFMLQVFLTFCYLVHYGQEIENASEEVYEAVTQLEWYYFNQRNRNFFLMLLLITLKPIKFDFSSDLAIDYDLGVRMSRGIYSVISLIVSSRNYRGVS